MRKSKLNAISDEDFKKILQEANSYADVIRAVNLRVEHGPTYRIVKKRVATLGLSTSHFDPSQYRKSAHLKNTIPLEEILVEGREYSSSSLRKRLVKAGMLEYKCYECDNKGEWRGKKLQLQLDHKNGNHKDNRIENLHILCPNCHTQTPTHSAGNKTKKMQRYCLECCAPVGQKSQRCRKCAQKHNVKNQAQPTKILWPTKEELEIMIWAHSVQGAAKMLGVSGASIIKRCKRWSIRQPPKGYWAKRQLGNMSHEDALKPTVKTIKTPLKRLTEEQLTEIRVLLSQKISCRKIALRFGAHHSTISAIKRGEYYKMAVTTVAATASQD